MAKTPKTEDQRSEKEAAELRDAALKRALNTPPKPKKPKQEKRPKNG